MVRSMPSTSTLSSGMGELSMSSLRSRSGALAPGDVLADEDAAAHDPLDQERGGADVLPGLLALAEGGDVDVLQGDGLSVQDRPEALGHPGPDQSGNLVNFLAQVEFGLGLPPAQPLHVPVVDEIDGAVGVEGHDGHGRGKGQGLVLLVGLGQVLPGPFLHGDVHHDQQAGPDAPLGILERIGGMADREHLAGLAPHQDPVRGVRHRRTDPSDGSGVLPVRAEHGSALSQDLVPGVAEHLPGPGAEFEDGVLFPGDQDEAHVLRRLKDGVQPDARIGHGFRRYVGQVPQGLVPGPKGVVVGAKLLEQGPARPRLQGFLPFKDSQPFGYGFAQCAGACPVLFLLIGH